jgi:hypothetical protein
MDQSGHAELEKRVFTVVNGGFVTRPSRHVATISMFESKHWRSRDFFCNFPV